MENIYKSIKKRIRDLNLESSVEAARICSVAQKFANGRFIAQKFKNGILTISTSSQAEAAELYMSSVSLQKKVNQELKENLVKKIKIVSS